VIGIPRDSPHRVLSYEQTKGCETFYVYTAQTPAQAERKVMALVGRGIDKFYSSSPTLVGDVVGDSPSRLDDVTYSPDLMVEDYSAVRVDPRLGEQDTSSRRRGRFR
jgi:hypothetical protein